MLSIYKTFRNKNIFIFVQKSSRNFSKLTVCDVKSTWKWCLYSAFYRSPSRFIQYTFSYGSSGLHKSCSHGSKVLGEVYNCEILPSCNLNECSQTRLPFIPLSWVTYPFSLSLSLSFFNGIALQFSNTPSFFNHSPLPSRYSFRERLIAYLNIERGGSVSPFSI